MELASHMTQTKEPRLDRVNRDKNCCTKPLGKKNEVFRQTLVLFICSFQVLLFQNYVIYFLCRVPFISLMFRGRQSVYFAASDTTRHSDLFILLQQNLMQPYVRRFLKPPQSDIRCLSVYLCICVFVCLSVCLPLHFPQNQSLFSQTSRDSSYTSCGPTLKFFCEIFSNLWPETWETSLWRAARLYTKIEVTCSFSEYLTPRTRVLLQNPTIFHVMKKFIRL